MYRQCKHFQIFLIGFLGLVGETPFINSPTAHLFIPPLMQSAQISKQTFKYQSQKSWTTIFMEQWMNATSNQKNVLLLSTLDQLSDNYLLANSHWTRVLQNLENVLQAIGKLMRPKMDANHCCIDGSYRESGKEDTPTKCIVIKNLKMAHQAKCDTFSAKCTKAGNFWVLKLVLPSCFWNSLLFSRFVFTSDFYIPWTSNPLSNGNIFVLWPI